MSEETDSPETTSQPEETPMQSAPPQLALNDLSAAIQIIDLAASRGAFRGEELSQVGGVRDRLAVFMNAHMPPKPETEEVDSADEEE